MFFNLVGWGPWWEELKLVSSLRIELSFKVGRVGTLGGRVRVGTLGGGLGTLGVNLNLVSSSKLRLRLSFIMGGRAGNPGGRGGGRVGALFIIQCTQCSPVHTLIPRRAGTFQIPVHAMFPGAHLETPQGWDNNNNNIGGLPVNH